jgi:hypothetical protein
MERHGTNLTSSQATMSLAVSGLQMRAESSGGASGGASGGGGRGASFCGRGESLSRGGRNTHTCPSMIFQSF